MPDLENELLVLPPSLDREVARELLLDPDTDAFSALLSIMVFLRDDVLDEEGQPYLEDELRMFLEADHVEVADENLTRACGLLYAISGDEFLENVQNFRRFVSAVNNGRLFDFEDDDEEPELPDVFWAIYLAELLVEDDLTEELDPRIGRYLQQLAENEVTDYPGLSQATAEEGDDVEQIEDYMTARLTFRRHVMAMKLKRLGCQPEWLADTDPELAGIVAQS